MYIVLGAMAKYIEQNVKILCCESTYIILFYQSTLTIKVI